MAHILIVGANQGIGYYIVKRLLALGHAVGVLDVITNHIGFLSSPLYTGRLMTKMTKRAEEGNQ